MSTQSCTSSNSHWISLIKPYTGTKDQPDTVSIFYKHGNGTDEIEIADEDIINSMGHSPLNFITALPRINSAVKQIFKEFSLGVSRENSELWNAFKNLIRGMVQLVPLLGNAALYLHDTARNHFYFHPQLKTALAGQNEPVIGIAFDGKVIVSFSPDELKAWLNETSTTQTRDDDALLAMLNYMWLSMLQNASTQDSTKTRLQLAENLQQMVRTASRA